MELSSVWVIVVFRVLGSKEVMGPDGFELRACRGISVDLLNGSVCV